MTEREVFARGAAFRADPMIYGLVDPREPERVRYVGLAMRPLSRLHGHLADKNPQNARARWIVALHRDGLAPDMVVLERLTLPLRPARARRAHMDAAEARWIHELRDAGLADLNTLIPRRLLAVEA